MEESIGAHLKSFVEANPRHEYEHRNIGTVCNKSRVW